MEPESKRMKLREAAKEERRSAFAAPEQAVFPPARCAMPADKKFKKLKYNLDVEQNPAGFCILCEEKRADIEGHHKEGHDSSAIHAIARFGGVKVLMPVGTFDREIGQCLQCKGIFYSKRRDNHGCPNQLDNSVNECGGNSPYCVMCQTKCNSLSEHFKTVHFGNNRYTRTRIMNVETLIPEKTKGGVDLVSNKCGCASCPPFTYKNRLINCRKLGRRLNR